MIIITISYLVQTSSCSYSISKMQIWCLREHGHIIELATFNEFDKINMSRTVLQDPNFVCNRVQGSVYQAIHFQHFLNLFNWKLLGGETFTLPPPQYLYWGAVAPAAPVGSTPMLFDIRGATYRMNMNVIAMMIEKHWIRGIMSDLWLPIDVMSEGTELFFEKQRPWPVCDRISATYSHDDILHRWSNTTNKCERMGRGSKGE